MFLESLETSTSFYSPDSEESTSMISAGGSMILQNEVRR